jgi:hypothetical protein
VRGKFLRTGEHRGCGVRGGMEKGGMGGAPIQLPLAGNAGRRGPYSSEGVERCCVMRASKCNASRYHAQLMRWLLRKRRLRSGELTAGCFAVTFVAGLSGNGGGRCRHQLTVARRRSCCRCGPSRRDDQPVTRFRNSIVSQRGPPCARCLRTQLDGWRGRVGCSKSKASEECSW